MEFKIIVSGLASLAPGIKAIRSLVRESRGQQRILLRELDRNINRISIFLEAGAADDQIDKVIADLPQFKNYTELSTEELFDKLYSWIHRLKIIVADYPAHAKLRKNVRLINI